MDSSENQIANPEKQKTAKKLKKPKNPAKRKFIVALMVFLVGLVILVVGLVFLILNLNRGPAIQDGNYLVDAGEWMLQTDNCSDESNPSNCRDDSVIWDFTEIGKGTLTTNAHTNDYNFEWAIEDGKLIIVTDWLYSLENEYEYELNQRSGTLALKADDETYVFVVQQ